MKQAEYVGMVEKDGHLSLPDSVREQMRLRPDQVLRVTVAWADMEEPDASAALECWRLLGRNARPGRVRDASVRHDEYLYGSLR